MIDIGRAPSSTGQATLKALSIHSCCVQNSFSLSKSDVEKEGVIEINTEIQITGIITCRNVSNQALLSALQW